MMRLLCQTQSGEQNFNTNFLKLILKPTVTKKCLMHKTFKHACIKMQRRIPILVNNKLAKLMVELMLEITRDKVNLDLL